MNPLGPRTASGTPGGPYAGRQIVSVGFPTYGVSGRPGGIARHQVTDHPPDDRTDGDGGDRPVVLTSREHIIAMEPRGKGIMSTLLRYPYEVRDEKQIAKKQAGERIEVPKPPARGKVINLMDALRQIRGR
jgi:hypothetical protein